MYLVSDLRNGREWKTPWRLDKDTVDGLFVRPFLSAGVLSCEDIAAGVRCLDKWPWFKVSRIDGRLRRCRSLGYFTWRYVFE